LICGGLLSGQIRCIERALRLHAGLPNVLRNYNIMKWFGYHTTLGKFDYILK
jgi:hypothetical protein